MRHRLSALAAVSAVSLAVSTAAIGTAGAATGAGASRPTTSVSTRAAARRVIRPEANRGSVPAKAAVSNFGWESTNWSGYAVTGQGINAVSANWTVPTVQASSKAEYSASWVGVDGYNDQDLIQTGTGQDTANGATQYYAWWEVLPAAETTITTMTVAPGNAMSSSVVEVAAGSWRITLKDHTTGVTFTKTVGYNGPGTSAEWIEEAPTVNGKQATIADFNHVQFTNGTVDSAPVHLTSNEGGALVSQSGQIEAEPTAPDSSGSGFTDSYVGSVNGHRAADHATAASHLRRG